MHAHALDVREVTKAYPNGCIASANLTLHADMGEVVGLVGPNGAGKTTLVRQILGLLPPSSGTICVLGHEMPRESDKVKGRIGYVPQMPVRFPSLTAEETVAAVVRFLGEGRMSATARAHKALNEVGLGGIYERFGYQLSYGSVKLMNIAMALCQEPELLVLDEPTSMVDVVNRAHVRQLISRQTSRCVLLTSHDLADIQALCDRAYIISGGRVVAHGSPSELARLVGASVRVEIISYERRRIQEVLDDAPVKANWDGPRCRLICSNLAEALGLASQLTLNGEELESLRIEAPAFEDAILALLEGAE